MLKIESALKEIDKNDFDLILLDIMIPKINGFEVMEYVKDKMIPVIFLTAVSGTENIVKELKIGADDYIVKPFNVSELLSRIEKVLRRYNKITNKYVYKDIIACRDSYIVKKKDEIISLTKKEYDLLVLFFKNRNVALCRDIYLFL